MRCLSGRCFGDADGTLEVRALRRGRVLRVIELQVITTEAMVAEKPEDNKAAPPPMPDMGGMM